MLNQEGWSLLILILLLLLEMGLGFAKMGRERLMAQQLQHSSDGLRASAGVLLRCIGVLVLAVIPAAAYRGGAVGLGMALSVSAGLVVLLTVLVPGLRKRNAQALTLPEALGKTRGVRAVYAVLSGLQALILASGACTLAARLLAGVFSLHYTIALGACAALILLLTALCGAQSREKMDGVSSGLLILTMLGIFGAVLVKGADAFDNLKLIQEDAVQMLALDIPSDLFWGVSALGLMLPAQRLFGENTKQHRRTGAIAGGCAAALMLISALIGWLGQAVDASLVGQTAAETVLMQTTLSIGLPVPVSAALLAVMVVVLLLFAQDALHMLGLWVSWDLVQPTAQEMRERPLLRWALAVSLAGAFAAFGLGWNANIPIRTYALAGLLSGSVLAPGLLLNLLGRKVNPLGTYCGLGLGMLMAIVWLLVPQLRQMDMLGALPCAGLSVLLQLFVREKTPESAE